MELYFHHTDESAFRAMANDGVDTIKFKCLKLYSNDVKKRGEGIYLKKVSCILVYYEGSCAWCLPSVPDNSNRRCIFETCEWPTTNGLGDRTRRAGERILNNIWCAHSGVQTNMHRGQQHASASCRIFRVHF